MKTLFKRTLTLADGNQETTNLTWQVRNAKLINFIWLTVGAHATHVEFNHINASLFFNCMSIGTMF